MSEASVVTTSGFPQTSGGRTRLEMEVEMCEYTGGENTSEMRVRAGRALDSAVREYNTVGWRFNRLTKDITLVADTKTYTLETDFRTPVKAQLLDSNGVSRGVVDWIPYEVWLERYDVQTNGGPVPNLYTAFNAHNAGLVRFNPYPTGTLTYPTVQITYMRRIALAATEDGRLNVPMEADEGIFQLAVALFTQRVQGYNGSTQGLWQQAQKLRLDIEREHREWGEPTLWGASG